MKRAQRKTANGRLPRRVNYLSPHTHTHILAQLGTCTHTHTHYTALALPFPRTLTISVNALLCGLCYTCPCLELHFSYMHTSFITPTGTPLRLPPPFTDPFIAWHYVSVICMSLVFMRLGSSLQAACPLLKINI